MDSLPGQYLSLFETRRIRLKVNYVFFRGIRLFAGQLCVLVHIIEHVSTAITKYGTPLHLCSNFSGIAK